LVLTTVVEDRTIPLLEEEEEMILHLPDHTPG